MAVTKTVRIAAGAAAGVAALLLLLPQGPSFKIFSRILDEKRTILEFLPAGYQTSGRAYPVLFHLDADPKPSSYGPSFADVAEKVNGLGGDVPEMIVLGVVNTRRTRDMIPFPDDFYPPSPGKAHLFLRFLAEELIPEVESRYRTTDMRILHGRSDSGLFAIYALTAAPDAFQAVISSSPSLGRSPNRLAESVEKLFRRRPDMAGTLFIVYGSKEGPDVSVRVPELGSLIRRISSPRFILGLEAVPEGGHIPKSGLEDGLRFIFGPKQALGK